jgi:hypothetical protein
MSDKPSFFAERKRRNVYKVGIASGILAPLLRAKMTSRELD